MYICLNDETSGVFRGWWMYLPFFKAYITFKKFLKVLKLVLAS